MKTILTLCVMLLASASGASTNNLGTISAQQETKVQSSAIDDLIKSIHADILQLQTNHAWLSGYTNSCFWGNAIFFMPKLTESDGLQAQQPDQLCIVYGPIGQKKGFKYDNQVEDVPSCQFPELKLKVYAHILIRGNENAKCAEAVRECIIKHCEELHKQMKTSHLDRQPHR